MPNLRGCRAARAPRPRRPLAGRRRPGRFSHSGVAFEHERPRSPVRRAAPPDGQGSGELLLAASARPACGPPPPRGVPGESARTQARPWLAFPTPPGQPIPQRGAVDEVHDEVEESVGLSHLVDRDHVGVPQPGERPRFPPEAGRTPYRGLLGSEDLDLHAASELGSPRHSPLYLRVLPHRGPERRETGRAAPAGQSGRPSRPDAKRVRGSADRGRGRGDERRGGSSWSPRRGAACRRRTPLSVPRLWPTRFVEKLRTWWDCTRSRCSASRRLAMRSRGIQSPPRRPPWTSSRLCWGLSRTGDSTMSWPRVRRTSSSSSRW